MSEYNTDSSKWTVEPDAWISMIQCIGPDYGKKIYDNLPHQSLNPLFFKHEKLFAEKSVIGLMKSAYYDGYTAREQEARNMQNVCYDKNCITHDQWYAKCNELSASQAREAELREREMVLVKGLNALNYTASENSPNACIVRELLRMTPSQTSDQVLRWHVEWMRTLPVAAYGDRLGSHYQQVYCIPETGMPSWMMPMKELVAIPTLPESKL